MAERDRSTGGEKLGAAVVSATQLRLSYGAHVILDDATLAVHERDKIGVVGRNGCGKSSFMKILAGEEQPDAGEISVKSGLVVGFLSQEFTLREDETVMENIRDGAGGCWMRSSAMRRPTISRPLRARPC